MATTNASEGSFVVKRVRQGDTVSTRLECDKALYQGIEDGGGTPVPDWSVAANQPTITPRNRTSLKDGFVDIIPGSARWRYNHELLAFGADGICTGTATGGATGAGKFRLDSADGSLRITGNLASNSNTNVDNLRFDAVVNTGYETQVGADTDVRIELIGKNAYTGIVNLTSKTLKEGVTNSVTATAVLMKGVSGQSAFKTEWLKGTAVFKAKSAENSCAVSRQDVNGSQVFTCNFYAAVDGADVLVSSFLFVIYDSSDPYYVVFAPVGKGELTDSVSEVTLKAELRKRIDGAAVAATWLFEAYNSRARKITLSNAPAADTVRVTVADADRIESGEREQNNDILIACEATYTI